MTSIAIVFCILKCCETEQIRTVIMENAQRYLCSKDYFAARQTGLFRLIPVLHKWHVRRQHVYNHSHDWLLTLFDKDMQAYVKSPEYRAKWPRIRLNLDLAARYNDLPYLTKFLAVYKSFGNKAIRRALEITFRYDHVEVFQVLKTTFADRLPEPSTLCDMVIGRQAIKCWRLLSEDLILNENEEKMQQQLARQITYCVRNNLLEMARMLSTHRDVHCNLYGIPGHVDLICEYGDLEGVKFMHEMCLLDPRRYRNMITHACQGGQFLSLQYLIQHVIPSEQHKNLILTRDLFYWGYRHGAQFRQAVFNDPMLMSCVDTSYSSFQLMIHSGNVEELDAYLKTAPDPPENIFILASMAHPSKEKIDTLVLHGYEPTAIEWAQLSMTLMEHFLPPSSMCKCLMRDLVDFRVSRLDLMKRVASVTDIWHDSNLYWDVVQHFRLDAVPVINFLITNRCPLPNEWKPYMCVGPLQKWDDAIVPNVMTCHAVHYGRDEKIVVMCINKEFLTTLRLTRTVLERSVT